MSSRSYSICRLNKSLLYLRFYLYLLYNFLRLYSSGSYFLIQRFSIKSFNFHLIIRVYLFWLYSVTTVCSYETLICYDRFFLWNPYSFSYYSLLSLFLSFFLSFFLVVSINVYIYIFCCPFVKMNIEEKKTKILLT